MEQPHTPKRKCSATGKVVFASHEDAKLAIFALKWNYKMRRDPFDGKRIKHRQGRPQQRRAYYCAHCGGFHLTRMETPFPQDRDEPREPPLSSFIGVLKRYDAEKGNGVVVLPDGNHIGIRRNLFPRPFVEPQVGDVFVGHHRKDLARGRDVAVCCRQISKLDDWALVSELLGQDAVVRFADRADRFASVFGKNMRVRAFSLLELGAMQLCLVHSDEELHQLLFGYYCEGLDSKRFIRFATVIEKAMLFSRGVQDAARFLNKLFSDFGGHATADVLFCVWQKRAFHLVGYPKDQQELELDQAVFEQQQANIRPRDLVRIQQFSYGPEFCAQHVETMLEQLEWMTERHLNMMLGLLHYLSHSRQTEWKTKINFLIIHPEVSPPGWPKQL